MTEKYEYMMRCYNGMTSTAILEDMNKLGKEGWHLISNMNNLSCTGINAEVPMAIFMRSYAEIQIIND